MCRVLETTDQFFQNARDQRARIVSEQSGVIGDPSKTRKSKVVLVEDFPELREETMDIIMEAIYINGCRPLMDAINKHDDRFIEWGLGCLAKAKRKSTDYTHPIVGEGHLLGDTPGKVEEGKSRVAALLEKLEADGITCKEISVFSVALQATIAFNGATFAAKISSVCRATPYTTKNISTESW